jgi:thiol-disulfide isomerase/thioredoxin
MALMSHPVFDQIQATQLRPDTFDAALLEQKTIVAIFFWGHDCPNCEIAKRMIAQDAAEVSALNFKWHHVNVYEDSELGTRFGLHGIPTFLFFYHGKKLGRISPFPGMTPFMTALQELRAKFLSAPT